MAETYTVKGSSIVTKFDYAEEHFGTEARKRLEERFSDRKLLPVVPASWYPFKDYADVLESLSEMFLQGDLSRLDDVGSYSARRSLSGIYQSFVISNEQNFLDFLGRISALHGMFYSHGNLQVKVRDDGKGCSLWHRDKPEVRACDLYVAQGFYKEAGRLHGIDNIRCTFEREDGAVRFDLRWD